MSSDLEKLCKEYKQLKPTLIVQRVSLYQRTIHAEASEFLRNIEKTSKQLKQPNVKLVAILVNEDVSSRKRE